MTARQFYSDQVYWEIKKIKKNKIHFCQIEWKESAGGWKAFELVQNRIGKSSFIWSIFKDMKTMSYVCNHFKLFIEGKGKKAYLNAISKKT